MSRYRLLALLAPALGFALTACATTPPGTPSVTPTTPTPSATSLTQTPTPTSLTPTPTATQDEGANLVLAGTGLGGFKFGTKESAVVELLTDQLGDPDESSSGILCELDDSSPWAQTVTYGGLWVQYQAKDQSKKSPRTLGAWGFQLSQQFGEPLQLADGVLVNLTFKQLKAKYPSGKLENLNLGEGDGTRMFTLPNKIRFIGVSKPEVVTAGTMSICE